MRKLDPAEMTITEAAAAIAAAELKPSELVEACLDRIGATEHDVKAWSHVGADLARMAARLIDTSTPSSPLHGIPFGIKDIIDTADMPTGCGSPIFHDHRPARDASCVALLKEGGGICVGKTVTTELAHFHPGKTHNPQRLSHTPGGSSSGSAAAVAACMVPFAIGTQTTGSTLRPASFCGVFGYKPSFGDVNRSGVFECVSSFDTVGWFARCVADIELVRRALLRMSNAPLALPDVSQLRIGFFRGPHWDEAEGATQDLIAAAAGELETAGAKIVNVETPSGFEDIAGHHRTIAGYEFARAITWERTQRGPLLSAKLLEGRCGDGLSSTYDDYVEAHEALNRLRANFADVMQSFDLLITPVAPGEALPGLGATGDPVFNTMWTALYVPALSVPAFKGPTGLPVGLQLVGRFRQDEKLLAAAQSVAEALGVGPLRALPS